MAQLIRSTHRLGPVSALLLMATFLSGCTAFNSARGPDSVYSSSSAEARSLQVPPDLTDISDAEQFVLPGDGGGPISRNTLLPQVGSARFRRSDSGSWLEIDAAPEAVWPQLIEFLRSRGFDIAQTSPVAGTLSTRWSGAASGGVLRNLIGGDDRERVSFRIERDGAASRLFARRQVADADELDSAPNWPESTSNPEAVSELLAQLLVYLGVSEQESQGIISAADAADILSPATVRTTSAGTQMVVHRGFLTAFDSLTDALQRGGSDISSRDDSVGRIAFTDATAVEAEEGLVLSVVPVHISAVRVAVTDGTGRRLSAEDERQVLSKLVDNFV